LQRSSRDAEQVWNLGFKGGITQQVEIRPRARTQKRRRILVGGWRLRRRGDEISIRAEERRDEVI
jgi:hypothetical protein